MYRLFRKIVVKFMENLNNIQSVNFVISRNSFLLLAKKLKMKTLKYYLSFQATLFYKQCKSFILITKKFEIYLKSINTSKQTY